MTIQQSQQNRLLGLADSTLRRLLQFLEDSELYELSMTCVQIHKPALSMLLLRRGIPDPLDTVDIQLHAVSNTLQVLRVALFVPTIRRFLLRFTPKIWTSWFPLSVDRLQEAADCLLKEMQEVRRLFEKLESVDEITLIFPGSLQWNLRDVNLERGETSDIFPWSHVISFLQNAVEMRCRSFQVENSPFQMSTYSAKARRRRLLARLTKALKWKQERDTSALARCDGVKYRPQRPAAHSSGSSIQHFHIRTTLLLFPCAAGWTLSILRSSPIVSLHISGLNISSRDWDVIAPKLFGAIPNLLEFHLEDGGISPDCLMQMLRNLTKLTSLTIGPNMFVCLKYPRIFPPFSACFLPAFRNLVKLSAPVSYVRLFLMRRDPLPALRQLKLPPIDTAGAATYHHKNLHLHLPHIINQLRGLNHSVYPLPVTFCLGRKGEASPAKHIDMSLALDPKVADNLREITHLVLSDEFDSRIHPPSLCRWLRLFPALQQISWDNSGPASVATKDVPNLVREIFRACPTVETIFAQGVRYTPIEIIEESNNVSTAFVDLPAEVLLLIFAFLHRDELFSLSILCRRFHFLALPLFLERNFIENPSEMTNINFAAILGSEASILCALTIALFLPSIKRLVCLFPATHIHQRVDSIRRVTRLVRRLETIDNISLEFISDRCRLRDFGDSYSEERLWQACFSALRDLLEAVDSKSCTSLTIIGSPAMVASTLTAPSLPPPTMSSLTTISLNVGCSAAYSSWILSGLKDSPVASLKLTVTEVELAAANFPTSLTTLSLAGTYTPRAKVMKYLARHPHLKTLNLAGNLSQYFSEAAPDAVPAVQPLLQLHDLTASLSYISYFFLYAHDPPFPALKHLTILVDNLCNVGWALSSLIERVRECYPHPLTFALEITDLWNGRFLSDSVGFLTSMGGKWTHAARHIACLKCAMHFDLDSDGRMGVDSDLVQISLSWLGLFRGLRDVKIESLGRRGVHPPVAELVKFGNLIGEGLPSVHIAIQVDQRTVFER